MNNKKKRKNITNNIFLFFIKYCMGILKIIIKEFYTLDDRI